MVRFLIAAGALGLLYGCASQSAVVAPPPTNIVATIDGQGITWPELQREYARSKGISEITQGDTVAAYIDFLERYVDYRLKVLEARNLGLASVPEVAAEIQTYREQYARPYLLDRAVLLPIARHLYERKQEAIDVSHILISARDNAAPEDTLSAYNTLVAIADSIRAGADFAEMARRHSTDPSASDERRGPGYGGRLGYITGGVTVAPFEDIAWSTPTGEVSAPLRTQFGYHVVKVHDRRPAPPDIRISHIMITPKGSAEADSQAALTLADSLYTLLERGADFDDLADRFSDDRQSADRGGDLGFIAFAGRFVPEMRTAAFNLEEIGDVTAPVHTQYGYHLIKLTERKQPATFEEAFDEFRQQAGRSAAAVERERAFADSILVLRGATLDTTAIMEHIGQYGADSLGKVHEFPAPWGSIEVATIGDSTYSLKSFVQSTSWRRLTSSQPFSGIVRTAATEFMRQKAISYETYVLEANDAEFARTIDEFRNGILLFNLMEDSVWTAAAQDSIRLQAIYDEDPSKYRFPDRTIVTSVYSRSSELVAVATALISSGLSGPEAIDSLNAAGALTADTTLVAGQSNSVYDRALALDEGLFTHPLPYNNGFIALRRSGIDPARVKTFEESRAELVSELQTRLEQRLVARLRSRYDARTHPDRLIALLAAAPGVKRATTAADQ